MPSHRWKPVVALILLTLIWGYTWVVSKAAFDYAPPFAFAAQRAAGGALALMLALRLMGRPLTLVAPWPTLRIGLIQYGGFYAFQTWALYAGGVGKTAVLVYTMPIWGLMLAWVVLGERIRGSQWIAAISTLVGLILIIAPWNPQASLMADVLGVIAALCWAVGSVLVKRLRATVNVDLLAMTAWQMALGCVPLLLIAAWVPEPATRWTPHYVGILAMLCLGSLAVGWCLWAYILDTLPAWEASLAVLGTPVVAIASSRWLLGERFSATEVAGMLLIGGGLTLLSLRAWWLGRRSSPAGRPETDGPAAKPRD